MTARPRPFVSALAHAHVVGALAVAASCAKPAPVTKTVNSPVASACAHAEGNTLKVMAEFDKHCLSSSCDTVKSATCTLSLNGTEISVKGEAVVETVTNQTCTSDCGSLTASCELELEPGGYRVRAGNEVLEILHPPSAPVGKCDRLR